MCRRTRRLFRREFGGMYAHDVEILLGVSGLVFAAQAAAQITFYEGEEFPGTFFHRLAAGLGFPADRI